MVVVVGVESRTANRIITRMGVCVFVASGLNFDVDAYLKRSRFKPRTVFRKGHVPPLGNPQMVPRPDSGFALIIGKDDQPGIASQVPVAFKFLLENEDEFKAMKKAGVDNRLLDFNVLQQTPTSVADYLPPELLIAMVSLGMGMMISVIALPKA